MKKRKRHCKKKSGKRKPGFSILVGAVQCDPNLSWGAKVLYARLRRFEIPDGKGWVTVGQERLARDLNCKRQTISKYKGQLEERGLTRAARQGVAMSTST